MYLGEGTWTVSHLMNFVMCSELFYRTTCPRRLFDRAVAPLPFKKYTPQHFAALIKKCLKEITKDKNLAWTCVTLLADVNDVPLICCDEIYRFSIDTLFKR